MWTTNRYKKIQWSWVRNPSHTQSPPSPQCARTRLRHTFHPPPVFCISPVQFSRTCFPIDDSWALNIVLICITTYKYRQPKSLIIITHHSERNSPNAPMSSFSSVLDSSQNPEVPQLFSHNMAPLAIYLRTPIGKSFQRALVRPCPPSPTLSRRRSGIHCIELPRQGAVPHLTCFPLWSPLYDKQKEMQIPQWEVVIVRCRVMWGVRLCKAWNMRRTAFQSRVSHGMKCAQTGDASDAQVWD